MKPTKHSRRSRNGLIPCWQCGEMKPSSEFTSKPAPAVKHNVNFKNQTCDECVNTMRINLKTQVVDCRIEDNMVVKTLAPGLMAEPFDRYAAVLADFRWL